MIPVRICVSYEHELTALLRGYLLFLATYRADTGHPVVGPPPP